MFHFILRHGGGQTRRYRRHVEFQRYSRWEGKPGFPLAPGRPAILSVEGQTSRSTLAVSGNTHLPM